MESIGRFCFAGCISLELAVVPVSVTTILPNAFGFCGSQLVMHGESESTAEQYAADNGITFSTHTYSEWITDVYPTYEAEGIRHRNCTVCAKKELCTIPVLSADDYIVGDIDSDGDVDIDDALYLFCHSMAEKYYPISYRGSIDFNNDGNTCIKDAVYLFNYSILPDVYCIEQR